MAKKPTAAKTDATVEIPEKRKSVVKKSISRTIKSAQYESLVITDHIEETVEWSSLEEYDRKNKNWETILIQRYKSFHDKVCTELGLSHKVAYFKNPSEDTKKKYENLKSESVSSNSHGLNLDDLDTLGG